RLDVRRMQLNSRSVRAVGCIVHDSCQGRAYGARTAAKINDDGVRGRHDRRLADEELSAPPWNEDPGIHREALTAELGPAKDMFEGDAGNPQLDHGGKLRPGTAVCHEQLGLLLGKHTP